MKDEDFKKFIKELKEQIKREADKILLEAGSSLEEYKGELPLINYLDTLAHKYLIKSNGG